MLQNPDSFKLLDITLDKFAQDMSSAERTYKANASEALNTAERAWNFGYEFKVEPQSAMMVLHKHEIHGDNGSPSFLVPQEIKDTLNKRVTEEKLVEYVNPRASQTLLKEIESYFKRIGALNDNVAFIDAHLQDEHYTKVIKDKNVVYTAQIADGTSRLLHYAIHQILKNKGDAVIIATPTYGLFINPIKEQDATIIELPVNSKDDFKPNATQLANLIKKTNDEFLSKFQMQLNWLQKKIKKLKPGKFSKSFKKDLLKSIKALSASCLKKQINIENIEELVAEANSLLEKEAQRTPEKAEKLRRLQLRPLNLVRAFINVNPSMPLGKIMSQDDVNALANTLLSFEQMFIIDDICYYDLMMQNAQKEVGTFSKSSAAHKTITLYGLSKQFGLASLRSAVAFGPNELLQPMLEAAFYYCPTQNIYSQVGLESILRWDDKARKKYLKKINDEYAFRRDFTIAMFRGIKYIIQKEHQVKIEEFLSKEKYTEKHRDKLFSGIVDLNILTYPESGFFLVLDFAKYKGKYIGSTKLETSLDFYLAMKHILNVETIPMEMCFDTQFCGLRFSYSISLTDITEAALRMHNFFGIMTAQPREKQTSTRFPLELVNNELQTSKKRTQQTAPILHSYRQPSARKRISIVTRNDDFVWEAQKQPRNLKS